MAVAWFAARYKRFTPSSPLAKAGRYCVIDDYQSLIDADGGDWRHTEVLGNIALCKVRASAQTLQTIAADPLVLLLPTRAFSVQLSDLTPARKTALRNFVLGLGYTAAELQAALGSDLGTVTFGDLMRFLATRRRAPRYDAATDTIVFDGPEATPDPVDDVDAGVS